MVMQFVISVIIAATSVIWTFRDDPNVKEYCKDLERSIHLLFFNP